MARAYQQSSAGTARRYARGVTAILDVTQAEGRGKVQGEKIELLCMDAVGLGLRFRCLGGLRWWW